MLISLGVSHCSSGEKWLSSWQQENPSLKTNQVYSFYPYYTYYLEVLTCSLCLSCYTRFQLHYLLCLCLYFGKGGVFPRKVLLREWPHSFYTSAGGIRAEIGWWEKAQAQWARTFFRSNSVDEEERRAAFFGLTPPHHACHSHSTGQLLYCTPCVCANILAAWKHTRHFDTQGRRKKKGFFPKNNKTFSWKPVVAVARHPVFYQACWWQMPLNTWRVLC